MKGNTSLLSQVRELQRQIDREIKAALSVLHNVKTGIAADALSKEQIAAMVAEASQRLEGIVS